MTNEQSFQPCPACGNLPIQRSTDAPDIRLIHQCMADTSYNIYRVFPATADSIELLLVWHTFLEQVRNKHKNIRMVSTPSGDISFTKDMFIFPTKQSLKQWAEDNLAPSKPDAGAHYRFQYKGINLDPFRISKIYGITDFAQLTVLKKVLCAGNRGYKDTVQDIDDCICALERWKEMLAEDASNLGTGCKRETVNGINDLPD